MQDQVAGLQKRGIKAISLQGGLSRSDVDRLLENCVHGDYKFLFLSPERLQQEIVQERIRSMQVNLLAIDEAHCVSQWGDDFRPAYRQIMTHHDKMGHPPVIALTATATDAVVQDITDSLLGEAHRVIKTSFARKNIRYVVRASEDKRAQLLSVLDGVPGTSIIYVRNRADAQQVSQYLISQDIRADFYHGGLRPEEKSTRLNAFLTDNIRCIVATSAFGMGIDKPDVRSVIHLQYPESLESYYQESGRAGRDGKTSYAVLIHAPKDAHAQRSQFVTSLPTYDSVLFTYKRLMSYLQIPYQEGEGQEFPLSIPEFGARYKMPLYGLHANLVALDRFGVITLSERSNRQTRLEFLVAGASLTNAYGTNSTKGGVLNTLLRMVGASQHVQVSVDLDKLAYKAGASRQEVILTLKDLHAKELIQLTLRDAANSVLLNTSREDEHTINPIRKELERQTNVKVEKADAVVAYVENDRTCRSVQLLAYFSEESSPCGTCDVCLMDMQSSHTTKDDVLLALQDFSMSLQQLAKSMGTEGSYVVKHINTLLEEGKIEYTANNKIRRK